MAGYTTSTTSHRDLVYATVGAFASLVFVLSMVASPLMGLGVSAAAAALCLGLFAPTVLLLAWLAADPSLSTWLDVRIGPFPALTPDRALLMVLVAVTAWRWLRRPQTLLPLGRLELLMAGFIIYAAASAVAGGGSQQKNLAAVNVAAGGLKSDFVFLSVCYALPFLGFFMTKNLVFSERHIRWLLAMFIAVGIFVAFTGILQYFTSITIFTPKRMEVAHLERATGTMASAPEFGMVVGIPLLTAIICFLRSRFVPEKLVLAGAIAFMGFAIVLAKTRGIWVGLVVGLAVAALYERGLRRRLGAVALASAMALIAAWPLIANSAFIQYRVLDMVPIYARIINTATALNMFRHSPVVGFGFGRYTYDSEKWPYLVDVGGVSSQFGYPAGVPHNEYLHILVLLGLIGFIPYSAMLVTAWRTASRLYRETFADVSGLRRDSALIFLSVFAFYLTTALAVDAFGFVHASLQIYALLGALDGLRVRELALSRSMT
jgi:O-antigen ligase